jgi:hypothetical protein
MPRDNGFTPGHDYSWFHKPEDIPAMTRETIFHINQAGKVLEMYNAIETNYDEAFEAWCNDPTCQQVIEQLQLDNQNQLMPQDKNVYHALINAYNRAFNTNLVYVE